MKAQMEILCVGNELLIGKILNTNAQWLARCATKLGISVKQITVVPDDVNEIARAVREALTRNPEFIITTGGLGPTFDDKTLGGIARAIDRKLETNEKALKMIRERYNRYVKERKIEQAKLTPARIKMAKLPQGAEPLPNSVGTAPGVKIRVNSTLLAALPGVPPEMEAIFEESVAPLLKRHSDENRFFETSLYSHGIMESALAPLIDQVMQDNQHVYIKSHPKAWRKGIEIHFSTTAKDKKKARDILGKATIQLSELAQAEGAQIKLEE
jgi:molybdenum cofactor synthesis domain-containing protein